MNRRQLLYIALSFVLVMGFASFGVASWAPTLTGEDQAFDTNGYADDADPATPPARYNGAGPKSGIDGDTQAHSRPISFKRLNGVATAKLGPRPTGVARSHTDDEVTSSFEVTAKVTCKLQFDTLTTVTVKGGEAYITARVEFLNETGSVVGIYEREYTFKESPKVDKIDVYTGRLASTLEATIPNGGTMLDIYKDPKKVEYSVGPHELTFNLEVKAAAEDIASVNATVLIDFIDCEPPK